MGWFNQILTLGIRKGDDVNKIRLIRQLNGLNLMFIFVAPSVGALSYFFLGDVPGGVLLVYMQILATFLYASNLYLAAKGRIRFTQILTITTFEIHLFICTILTGSWLSPVLLVIVLYPLLAALVEVSILLHLAVGLGQFLLIILFHFSFSSIEQGFNDYLGSATVYADTLRLMGLFYFPVMAAGIMKIIFNENLRARQKQKEMLLEISESHEQLQIYAEALKDESINLRAELNVAKDIQSMMLPGPDETKLADQEVSCIMRSADDVGGDYYDIIHLQERFIIGIGDVTGHGLASGLIMLMAQTSIRTLAETGLQSPAEYLSPLNRVLFANINRIREDRNMTLALIAYNGQGKYTISGQHEYFIICRSDGRLEVHDTINLGFYIGMINDVSPHIDSTSFNLEKDDVLLLYSDGVTEAENRHGEQFGLNRLLNSLQNQYRKSAELIKGSIIGDVYNFMGEIEILDDITIMVIKQKV